MNDLGRMIKQQRIAVPLTLRELATASGVSASHLGRIERGERFPSAHILWKMAKPLGFEENRLFTLAGSLSSPPSDDIQKQSEHTISRLDPYVAKALAEEPFDVQRCVIGILRILKSLTKGVNRSNDIGQSEHTGA